MSRSGSVTRMSTPRSTERIWMSALGGRSTRRAERVKHALHNRGEQFAGARPLLSGRVQSGFRAISYSPRRERALSGSQLVRIWESAGGSITGVGPAGLSLGLQVASAQERSGGPAPPSPK
jgi:hypothetical protein